LLLRFAPEATDMGTQWVVREAGIANEQYWRDLWAARYLMRTLAARDISVRYRQTAIGVSWALLRPLLTMLAFTIVFDKLARLPSDGGMPYSLMVLAGMVPWVLFSTSLNDISNSLTGNTTLIEKVFFPRLVLPIASVSNGFLEFLISSALLIALMVAYGVRFTPAMALLPVFALLALLASLGAGIWCAAVNVRYRDVRFIVPFAIQIGLYVSPIGFSSQLVPQSWKPVYYLNPMAAVVDGFRWCVNGAATELYWPGLATSALVSTLLLGLGLRYFRRTERTFADYI
jgi:lipopolysaccharide transport system permease protein